MAGPGWILIAQVVPDPQKLLDAALRVVLIVAAAFVAQRLLFILVRRVERLMVRAGHGNDYAEPRAKTVGSILRSVVTFSVAGIALMNALAAVGVDIRPLLAGAGIVGLALGFGAQTLVRDVIAGVFILAENQYAVGDLIEVNGRAATVESLTVRSTTLRDFNGYMHFVPNGEMKVVTNRSRGWNRLAVDVAIGADQDVDRALELCRKVVDAINAEALWKERLLDPVELWGIESLSASEVTLRMVVRARPGGDAPEAARELRRRVLRSLLDAGIRPSATPPPSPPRTLAAGGATNPT
jgi:small conductance mechanosensitive channel